ncbi:MAG: hypothetical protein UR26_C0001G0198 [candidate division TM6 bacterium GW2011_GWF2_32_72]|nr:MAG: hypothetical protein UR26_C0001G0198 [candidate division TM6 bacterium GW2011_GWF2_32_72]
MQIFKFLSMIPYILWYSFKVMFQVIRGVWGISKLPQPVVTIFGGSRFKQDNFYAKKAFDLGHMLAQNEISVITGGGPGIMEAASCGAAVNNDGHVHSLGIGVKGLEEELLNHCSPVILTEYFFARKWLLVRYSSAFAVFPGGFGTIDEFSEILTLMQTKRIAKNTIVLIGVDYWKKFMEWMKESALKEGMIREKDFNLFVLTDDLDMALKLLCTACKGDMETHISLTKKLHEIYTEHVEEGNEKNKK